MILFVIVIQLYSVTNILNINIMNGESIDQSICIYILHGMIISGVVRACVG